MRTSPFSERLLGAARSNRSWLCVGLDPEPSDDVVRFLQGIVEATRDLVCCFKPNLAFYEALGSSGYSVLRSILDVIGPDIPVLVDAKRGDAPNSMQAYARAIFDELDADAVTLNPYLGGDSLAPFFAYPDRGVFVLCKTSNPGAGEIQDLLVQGEPLFLSVARAARGWDRHGTLGYVVGATYPRDVAAVRAIGPELPILLPGVGAQGGDLVESVRAGVDMRGAGLIVSASRSILYASRGADWQAAARHEAERLRNEIESARGQAVLAAP